MSMQSLRERKHGFLFHRTLRAAAIVSAAAVLPAWTSSTALADADWRQFRGPNGQGRAETRGLPLTWSETENIAWKSPIPGKGWSSPVVLGNDIWITTALDGGKSLRAVCVDLDSGAMRHNVEVFTPTEPVSINEKNSHASPSPVIEPGRVYVHFGAMGTACLDAGSGRVLWRNHELVIDHKEGPGSSPILFEDLLIVNCDGQDKQYVVALDKRSGEIVWKTNRSAPFREQADFRKAYSTPIVIQVDGRRQLISAGADQVQSYDPRTGRELWRVRYQGFSNVPVPLFEDGMVYLCTGYTAPELWAIRANGTGDVTETHVVWKFKRQVPSNPSPVLWEGRIYLAGDRGVATCVDAKTGALVWQERLGDNYTASPICAENRIYFASEGGKVTVVEPGAKFRVLASNLLDGRMMATAAVAGNSLIFRTADHLYCVQRSPGAAASR